MNTGRFHSAHIGAATGRSVRRMPRIDTNRFGPKRDGIPVFLIAEARHTVELWADVLPCHYSAITRLPNTKAVVQQARAAAAADQTGTVPSSCREWLAAQNS